MQNLAELPPIVQIVLSIGMLMVSVVVYIVGNLKKTLPPTSKDVIIPSIQIADRAVIREMVDSFSEANRSTREVYDAARDVVYELKSIAERINQIERNQRALIKAAHDASSAQAIVNTARTLKDERDDKE
jgi:hypothetical protein